MHGDKNHKSTVNLVFHLYKFFTKYDIKINKMNHILISWHEIKPNGLNFRYGVEMNPHRIY